MLCEQLPTDGDATHNVALPERQGFHGFVWPGVSLSGECCSIRRRASCPHLLCLEESLQGEILNKSAM